MYSALMNFLYSTENKPLYFPVICKVLKKMEYTPDAASFLCLLQFLKLFLVLLKVCVVEEQPLVLFMPPDHQDLL